MQQRRVILERIVEGQDRGQDFVVDLDVRQGILCLMGAVGGDGGNGVARVEGLLSRHDVLGQHPRTAAYLGEVDGLVFEDGKVGGGDHRADPREGLRLARVDAANPGVRVRAP